MLLHLLPFSRTAVIQSGSFEIPDFGILGASGVLAGWDLNQSKAHPRLHLNTNFLRLPPFGRNLKASLQEPQFWGWGVRGELGIVS